MDSILCKSDVCFQSVASHCILWKRILFHNTDYFVHGKNEKYLFVQSGFYKPCTQIQFFSSLHYSIQAIAKMFTHIHKNIEKNQNKSPCNEKYLQKTREESEKLSMQIKISWKIPRKVRRNLCMKMQVQKYQDENNQLRKNIQ